MSGEAKRLIVVGVDGSGSGQVALEHSPCDVLIAKGKAD